MERIEHPKVFISYAWGSQDYQSKVLAFATALQRDGIEVLLDKWEISAGNDMNDFMEKSVNDNSVTNVIILIDNNYSKKANSRTGGVGTETQIISPEVYSSVEQTKFIPVILERGADGEICKPTYLSSRYHFDLSREETYNDEYQSLVKSLYGVERYKKPELGKRPSWVDEQISVSPKTLVAYDSLKNNLSDLIKDELLNSYLNEVREQIKEYASIQYDSKITNEAYLEAYNSNREIRKNFLLLLARSVYCASRAELLGDFFESCHNELERNFSIGSELSKVFLHEIFIYTIGFLLKQKNYKEIGYLLGRTYFALKNYLNQNTGSSFSLFYSESYHVRLDNAVKERDGKNYYSGTSEYWLSSIDINCCSKEDFISADILCYNYSVYGNGYLDDWKWFPITYVYANEDNNYITKLGRQLLSREKLDKILQIFNYDHAQSFIDKCIEIEKSIQNGFYRDYRYSSAFESAPLISFSIKASQIGTVR